MGRVNYRMFTHFGLCNILFDIYSSNNFLLKKLFDLFDFYIHLYNYYDTFTDHSKEISSGSSGLNASGFNTARTTILSPDTIAKEELSLPVCGVTEESNTMVDLTTLFTNK